MEVGLNSGVSEPVNSWEKAVSHDNISISSDISSSMVQEVCPAPGNVIARKKESVFPVPLPVGKLIREYAACFPSTRPRDRWRERSVSRARDYLVASRRRTAGLPPVFRPPADRVHNAVVPLRHMGKYIDSHVIIDFIKETHFYALV